MRLSDDVARPRVAVEPVRACLAPLVACLPFVLLLAFSPRAEPQEQTPREVLLATCTRVYDAGACGCAVAATAEHAPAEPQATIAGPPATAARRVEATRIPIIVTRDFARLVQACMSGPGAPAD